MDNFTLEKEFLAYSMKHKIEVTTAYLMHLYVRKVRDNGAIITDEKLLEKIAEVNAQEQVKKFMELGTLDAEYEKAWAYVVPCLPN